ncbi:hypothetical protein NEOC84_000845|nr:hypothetical protein [Neochlamydia sp. AcF84]
MRLLRKSPDSTATCRDNLSVKIVENRGFKGYDELIGSKERNYQGYFKILLRRGHSSLIANPSIWRE